MFHPKPSSHDAHSRAKCCDIVAYDLLPLQAAAAFNNVTGPGSAAAAAKFLQDVRNDTIGGVPVTIGTPYGMKPRNARKLLIHAHGGERASS